MISDSESVAADRQSETVAAVYDRRNITVSLQHSVGGQRPPLQQQTALTKAESAIRHAVGGHRPPLQVPLPLYPNPPCAGY